MHKFIYTALIDFSSLDPENIRGWNRVAIPEGVDSKTSHARTHYNVPSGQGFTFKKLFAFLGPALFVSVGCILHFTCSCDPPSGTTNILNSTLICSFYIHCCFDLDRHGSWKLYLSSFLLLYVMPMVFLCLWLSFSVRKSRGHRHRGRFAVWLQTDMGPGAEQRDGSALAVPLRKTRRSH